MKLVRPVAFLAAASLLGACGDDTTDQGPGSAGTGGTHAGGSGLSGGTGGSGGSAATGGSAGSGGGSTVDDCVPGEAFCLSHDTRRYCTTTADGNVYLDEQCAGGHGCVLGQCVPGACSDECTLGQTDGGKTCELYDIQSSQWLVPAPGSALHDRSRAYEMWLRRDGLSFGGVGNARYANTSYDTVIAMGGIGDSAIWTGTYLASEALRLMTTGSAQARANVIDAVQTLHLWFNVSGDPGLLARWVKPSAANPPYDVGDYDCGEVRVHCDIPYEGEDYDYIGHISRDQYQGVMLGYALAYEALAGQDEPTRQLIREDVVEFVQELMADRTLPIAITYNGTPLPAFEATLRFVVIASRELQNGAIQLILDTNNTDDSEMFGFQEFMPNLQDLAKQIPGIGGAIPMLPRSGSAVMLSSFFRVALLVTEGVPQYANEHAAILDYFENHSGDGGNIDDWLQIASIASPGNECGDSYYGNNIVMEPMYNLARLEDDPGRLAIIRDSVLDGWLWPNFVHTKNCFFSFIYAAGFPGHDPGVTSSAAAQLAGFPVPPRMKVAVDLLGEAKYQPHHPSCPNQCNHDTAVDVADRVWADFMWQRHPWALTTSEDLTKTAPGVDYLAAYWLGRRHGYLEDDTPHACLAWR